MRHYWVDRILQLEPGARAAGVKAVGLAEDQFEAHFPGNPVFPGVYVLEGLAQTAGVLLDQTLKGQRVAVMTGVERARFQSFARPGDQLRLQADLESLEDAFARVRGTASVDDRPVASARLSFKLVRPEQLMPAAFVPFWRQTIATWLGQFPVVLDA